MNLIRWTLLLLSAVAVAACGSSEAALGPIRQLTLSTAPDFTAVVSKVTFESAIGPGAGLYEQYDVWIAVAPSATTNAGVVVPKSGPVFVRSPDGATHAASADMIRSGDVIEVWHAQGYALGAVQGPPGAPTYVSRQIVIDR